MSWTNVDLATINPNLEIVPPKTYTFELLSGARYADDQSTVLATVAIVNDGEFTGRKLGIRYTPDEAKALKRLEQAIGIDAESFEDPVTYLNRAAGGRFMTDVRHSKPSEQYPNPKAFLSLWNVKPSA